MGESALGQTWLATRALAARFAVPDFEVIYHQYFDFVWSSTKRLGVDEGSMDDVVQEVFIVVHARLSTVQHPEALRSWIYGIVRRTVSGHRRSSRATRARDTQLAIEQATLNESSTSPLDYAEQAGDVALLASLLAGLDATKRDVFELVELEEMSVPEAAAALEIPLNTAYSRLRSARQEFEAALARHTLRSEGALRRCQT
jgi:RNA polymerase sigma-70 factor, ECF subfamily